MFRNSSIILFVCLTQALWASAAAAEAPPGDWKLASSRVEDGAPFSLYVEAEKTEGRPAFLVETSFEVSPRVAAEVLLEGMVSQDRVPDGQERRVLERTADGALVYTFLDLPFMLSDRELALRIEHLQDLDTGIHRVQWNEANHVLPPETKKAVRLYGAKGYWEFRPDGPGRSKATYMTQAEIGGSMPAAIGDRLMKGQTEDAVSRLRSQFEERRRTHVAGPPPVIEPAED